MDFKIATIVLGVLVASIAQADLQFALPKPMPIAKVGENYSVDLIQYTSASDPKALVFSSVDKLPEFLSLEATTGILSGLPSEGDIGLPSIVIEVDDNETSAVSYSRIPVEK